MSNDSPSPNLPTGGDGITFRSARRDDVDAIVRMLAHDPLGSKRERFVTPLPESYYEAFAAIDGDPNHQLIVAEREGRTVGVLQLSFLPYLTYGGRWRAQIEGVRVSSELRGEGLGRSLMELAIERARERGCHLVQLTTDRTRPEALRFYESLGFKATHEGMKLHF